MSRFEMKNAPVAPTTSASLNFPNTGNLTMNNLANNNAPVITGAEVTMSSLDFLNNIINPARVAAGENPHEPRKFLVKIEDELDMDGTGKKFRLNNNQTKTAYYLLDFEQMTLVGMRESKAVRRSVLEKLKALSKPAIDPMVALNDPEFLRGTLLTYTEKVITLEHQIQEMQPEVDALHRIAKADGSMCVTDAAKCLQTRRTDLFNYLSTNKWIYRRVGGKNWVAYQDKIQSGVLEHKVITVSRSDGREKVVEQVLVTPKGLAKLSQYAGRAY